MKKTLTTLIVGMIVAFFCAITIPLVLAQNPPSPQPTPSASQSASEPVQLEGETLFVIQTQQGGLSVQERAQRVNQRLRDLAENQTLSLDELEVYEGDKDGIPLTTISDGNLLLIAISDKDAQIEGKPRPELAQEFLQKIKEAVSRYRQERSLQYLLRALLLSAIATVALIVAVFITNNIFARIYQQIKVWGESYIRPGVNEKMRGGVVLAEDFR